MIRLAEMSQTSVIPTRW